MKKNDDTTKLYNEIYKNASMGAGTTKHLLAGKRGDAMTESLQKQYAEYSAICRNAEICMRSRKNKVKPLSPLAKMRTDSGVSLNLLFDRSDSHVAQMLITGSAMGVVNAQKKLNSCPAADNDAKALMQHLSDFEQRTIEEMKPYL